MQKDLDQVKRIPIASVIGRAVALKRRGNGLWGLCPLHNEKTPSLHVSPEKNLWHCFGCGAGGDVIEWVKRLKKIDFAAAVEILTDRSSFRGSSLNSAPATPGAILSPDTIPDPNTGKAYLTWCAAHDIRNGDAASLYLYLRGLSIPEMTPCLRYHPNLWCAEIGDVAPALIAAIEDNHEFTGIQRIWLTPKLETVNGEGPRDNRLGGLQARKKSLGRLGSGAVRLGRPGPTLGLAEGVEDAIAARLLFSHPVWAVCGANRYEKVARALPTSVREVVFFVDNDNAGLTQAAKAMEAISLGSLLMRPPPGHKDWNDVLYARLTGRKDAKIPTTKIVYGA